MYKIYICKQQSFCSREVLQLQLFKDEMLDGNDLLQSLNESLNSRDTYIHGSLETSMGSLQHLDSSQMANYSTDE